MRRSRSLALLLVLGACAPAEAPDPGEVEDGVVVEDGKEDNFLSLSAREYVLEGRTTVTVPEGTSEAEVKRLVSLKQIAVAWFLNQYLVDKEHEDENASYGGFGAMAKNGDFAALELRKVNGTSWEFKTAQIIAGRTDLLRKLPLESGVLTLEIGKPSNEELARLETNHECTVTRRGRRGSVEGHRRPEGDPRLAVRERWHRPTRGGTTMPCSPTASWTSTCTSAGTTTTPITSSTRGRSTHGSWGAASARRCRRSTGTRARADR